MVMISQDSAWKGRMEQALERATDTAAALTKQKPVQARTWAASMA